MKILKKAIAPFLLVVITACSGGGGEDFDKEAALKEFAENYEGIWIGGCEEDMGDSYVNQFEFSEELNPGEMLDYGINYDAPECEEHEAYQDWGPTLSYYEIKGEIDDGRTSGYKVILELPEENGALYHVLVSKIYNDGEGDYFKISWGLDKFPENFKSNLVEYYKSDVRLVYEEEASRE